MCTTCGCAEGEVRIEGEHHHHHGSHHHHHDHHEHQHAHDHSHHAHHSHPHTAQQGRVNSHVQVIHHYHGPVHHHHYYGTSAPANQAHTHEHQAHSHSHQHDHEHQAHGHDHAHNHDADHHHHEHANEKHAPTIEQDDMHYGHGAAASHAPGMSQRRMVQIEMDILGKNNHIAEHNREDFNAQQILALNLVSSPGSGKTTLLTETLERLQSDTPCAVIEGDQQTNQDAERIRATGVRAIQVNTGKGCHLDAQMIRDASRQLSVEPQSVLFIENVGNLVCPASFDLGERHKVAILSVTEGVDKPLKYPDMFAAANLVLINKIDLLPYVAFDMETCLEHIKQVNPSAQIIMVSATTGEGMNAWTDWLKGELCA